MYSVADYGSMIADDVRTGAFARALERAIRPDAVVLDVGTGTGIFALLACRFGARRVYAIEPDDVIQIARDIARENGYADRIQFIQAMSTAVTLPEKADVMISDLGGLLPWFSLHLPSIADARRRLLAPDGVLIPRRDEAWAAVVEAPDLYKEYVRPWDDRVFGLDMDTARRAVLNTWGRGTITREHLLTSVQRWGALDYTTVETPDVHGRLTWTVERPSVGHGIAAGFDRIVADGISLSNAPDAPEANRPTHIYRTVFFPWSAPVALNTGDVVQAEICARLIRSDYVWTWSTRVTGQGPSGADKASFMQSTFLGTPASATTLRKRAASYMPTLTDEGRMARLILGWFEEGRSVGESAAVLSAMFPARFPSERDALAHVADFSQQYG